MRLEALCSRAEHCLFELQEKLRQWGIAPAAAEEIISKLELEGFVDNRRFARAYCSDKFRFSRWGRVKIRHGLALKHVAKEVIEEALAEIDEEDYRALLEGLLRSKMRLLEDPRSYASRAKMARFAAMRGFEASIVIDCLKELLSQDQD